MDYSIAHLDSMNLMGQGLWPDGKVPWQDALAPDIEQGDRRWTGQLRSCPYCGSMYPADVAAALQAGAKAEWADWKYGWPHKVYLHDVPNPHVGLPEVRASSSDVKEGWIPTKGGGSHEPSRPAAPTTWGKFYSVHLKDAAPEDRAVIESYIGLRFEFSDEGHTVSWRKAE